MGKKRWVQFISAVAILAAPFFFQNCSPNHDFGSDQFASKGLATAGVCGQILFSGFQAYHDNLATGGLCLNCHATGKEMASKPFADTADLELAFNAFLDEGEEKIWNFALNPAHKAGFTGPQNEAILADSRSEYQQAVSEYDTCIADTGGESQVPADGLPTPAVKSANISIPLADDILDNAQTLDFTVNGIAVSIDIAAWETALGNRGYDISEPSLTAGGQTVYVKNMGIYINDSFIPAPAGTAFQNVDRYVAAGTTRTLFGSGVMNVTYDTLGDNTIAVAFEVVQNEPNVNFTPTTYTELVNGVFANNCAGCHNPNGVMPEIPLDDVNTYTLNALNGYFSPFDIDSQLLQSVLQDRMPQGMPLGAADKEALRGWILDGAPRD